MYIPGWKSRRQCFSLRGSRVIFFSVPVPFKEKMKKRHANARAPKDESRGEMLNLTRKLLVDFYRPHNVKMYHLVGDPAFLYHLS